MKRALLLALCLAGCGFHPLHGPQEAAADAKLPDIFVSTIGARSGQLLRQALQQRLSGSSDAAPQGYRLQVSYALENESIGIHGDNTSSRNRVVGRANWTLSTVAQAPVQVAAGSARSVDGYNDIEAQYFAATLANDSTDERIAGNLADSIATQISTWFVTHPNDEAIAAAAPPPPPAARRAEGFLGTQGVPGDTNQSPLQPIGADGLPSDAIGRTTR